MSLFEGSHVDLATYEIFCSKINQLPSAATKAAYLSYGFSKTIAEEMSEFATDNMIDLIKNQETKYDNQISNNITNAVNKKRNDSLINVEAKEFFYVEAL